MDSPFEESPLSPGAIIGHTVRLYRRHWRAWLGLSLFTYVPLLLLTQFSNVTADYGSNAPWGWLLVTLAFCFQALVMSGVGAILVSDSLRGERPSVWYALDLLFTQRLGRAFLAWLLVTIVVDVVSLPIQPLVLLNLIPVDTALALVSALPWIAGICLGIVALALIATRRQRYLPLFLGVAFIVVYSLVVIDAPNLSTDLKNLISVFSQGVRLLITGLLLLVLPAAVLDPAPLRQSAARAWAIARQNLPLIFLTVFLIGLATSLLENLLQVLVYALPGPIPSNTPVDLGPWQVASNYVNALFYYVPLSLVFVAAVFTPLQAIFATVLTLDGYWQFEKVIEVDEDEAESVGEEADVQVDGLDSSEQEASLPTGEISLAEEENEGDSTTGDAQLASPRPLITYDDLVYFLVLIAAGTVLSYGSNLIRDAFVTWLNQIIA